MPQVTQFSRFATQLNTFKPQDKLTLIDANRLDVSYQAFIKALAQSDSKVNEKKLVDAFAKKYCVSLFPEGSLKERVITYTNVFRNLFPALKIESQAYGFQVQKSKENPFQVQWDLIGNYIKDKRDSHYFESALIVLIQNSAFDTESLQIRALLDAGTKVTAKVAQKALLCDDPRFFELFLKRGYPPIDEDFKFLFTIENHQKKADKIRVLVDAGVKIPSNIAKLTFDDLNSFELLLSCGYKTSSKDFNDVCQIEDLKKALSFLKFFKPNGYSFSEEECIAILTKHFRKADKALVNELIETIYPIKKLHSALFQKMLPFARNFINFGYAPTSEDLKKAAEMKNINAIEAIVGSKSRWPWTTEEVLCILACPMYERTIETIFKSYSFTEEIFKAVIDRRWALTHIIKDNHNYENSLENRAKGSYEVTSNDIEYAIEKRVDFDTLDLLLHCWTYHPPQRLFQLILKDHPFSGYLKVWIDAGYRVDSADFQFACENCSYKLLSCLLNYGQILHEKYLCIGYKQYTRHINSWMVFNEENAGYIPCQKDLDFAREKKRSADVLALIEQHMQRKPNAPIFHND